MNKISKERIREKITTWSKFGDLGNGGITRLSLTKDALDARNEFKSRIEKLGMELEVDDVGNLYATLKGSEDLPRIVIASHMDSVKSGGNYDGIYGVLSGLEVAETLVTENIKLRHPLTVMVWTNEEGVRFEPAMMSSGIVVNKYFRDEVGEDKMPKVLANFAEEKMFQIKDTLGDNITFDEALKETGYKGDRKYRLNNKNYCAYFEPHIEQGPVLEDGDYNVGIVDGVVGMINYTIIIDGQSAHAGTFPQLKRKDAIKVGSQIIIDLWDKLTKIDKDLVFTTGELVIKPNVHTVVPNRVEISLDSRHKDPAVLEKVVNTVKDIIKNRDGMDGCKVSYEEHWSRDTVLFDETLLKCVTDSANELGLKSHNMFSGAGHDAQFANYMLPSVMIFIPSKDGLSHTVVEYSNDENLYDGGNVLLNAVLKRDKLDD